MKKTNENYIKEFHKAFGATIDANPSLELLELRKTLIKEETEELIDELDIMIKKLKAGETITKNNYLDALKEMADVQVVLSGTAVSIKQFKNFREAFIRVHNSNMSKLDENGKPIYRDDGKILKSKNYTEPKLDDLI